MSQQQCAIKDCKRASRTLCHCCNQNLCRDHFNQHDDLLNSQLNPLTDEVNALADRLSAINIDKITNDSRQKLDQWRLDCHQIIDRFYELKCEELHRYIAKSINEQRKEIVRLQSKMNELIEKQETTKNDIDLLTFTIRDLTEKMNAIERIHVHVDIRSLTIDDSLVQILQSKVPHCSLLNIPPPFGSIGRGRSSYNAINNSGRFVLTHIDENLCLIDEHLSIAKQKKWDYGLIKDLCWSSILKRFIVISKSNILLVNEDTMLIEEVQEIETEDWWAVGCSNESLYLSRNVWDSSVLEFSLLPSIQFKTIMKTNDRLQQKQRVDAIAYSNGKLSLAINDRSSKVKMLELRLSETFSLLWSIQFDVSYNTRAIRCCLLNCNEWIVADWSSSHLFRITNEGKIQEISIHPSTPSNVNVFHSNILVILTPQMINFHRLQNKIS